jgi:CRISPR-associated endonuclease/helicase Cas3
VDAQVTWFAHSTAEGDRAGWEPLRSHLIAVSDAARGFGAKFNSAELTGVLGLLHDLGKYDDNFLRRLAGENIRHDHSTAGACIAAEHYDAIGKLLAYAVAGHHAGLANGVREEREEQVRSALDERLKRGAEQARAALMRAEVDGIVLPTSLSPGFRPSSNGLSGFQLAFFGRMLFSCLVDADFLETERFYVEASGIRVERPSFPEIGELKAVFDAYMEENVAPKADTSSVNRLRADILAHARGQAEQAPGVFTLTVPTGGGKTLTSLAFALDHAVRHGLDRVIYVIPFTSIIEQTADVFRAALGPHAGAVLEHHSAFDEARLRLGQRPPDEVGLDADREMRMLRLAAENWDAPVVVTTAVQFFESLFADRPSRCRKLHNLAKSVIILDEAQTMPVSLLRPCVAALQELARSYGASVVLCTATQPALNDTADPNKSFKGGFRIGDERELAPNPRELFQKLKRVTIEHAGVLSDEALMERLAVEEQALCIVNTRAHARELYERLKEEPSTRHLSTLMCAAHRREALARIRADLKAGRPCRVISTSLIEAGVDVDFPLVYRAEAGLDSIAQAAGRCNREGKRDWRESRTVTFEVEDKVRVLKSLRINADVGRRMVRAHKEDSLAPEVIENYFREVYWLKGEDELDRHHILGLLNKRARSFDFPFETVARAFRMIEDVFVPVIVPYGEAASLVAELHRIGRLPHPVPIGGLARKLQPFTVGVPQNARAALIAAGAAEVIAPECFVQQFVWLTNADLYKPAAGLDYGDPTFRDARTLMV